MTKDEALKMAIDALAKCKEAYLAGPNWQKVGYDILDKSQQACKEALERPAQEPVAWIKALEIAYIQSYKEDERVTSRGWRTNLGLKPEPDDVPLYTHPAPSWQGLTSEEIESLDLDNDVISVIFQTEMLLKEKNT